MKLFTILAALLVGGSVAAQETPATPPSDSTAAPAVAAAPPSSMPSEGTNWGLQFDVGAPSAATAALVWRPWSFIRLNGGFGYNLAAFGVKGGVTLIPFDWAIVPTIGFEGGHFFEGDMSKTAFWEITDPTGKVLAKQFSYNYLSADLGVEFGAQNRFVFYVRAGVTQVWSDLKNVQQAIDASSPGKFVASQASFTGRAPTARIGFILYLF